MVVSDLTTSNPAGAGSCWIYELKSGRSRIRIWEQLVLFGSQDNTPDKTSGVSNAVSCYKAVEFSAYLLCYAPLPVLTKFV